MQVQVNTDNQVEGREQLIEHVQGVVRDAVDRHADVVTHVEAHLSDVNSGDKSGADDMRCVLEAHVAGMKNIAVKHQAESLHLAIEGAADKLTRALESALGKLRDQQRRHAGTGELSADAVRQQSDNLPPALADATDPTAGDAHARIDPQDDDQLRDWAERFDVTPQQIRDAVQAVGNAEGDVELYLKGSRSASNADAQAQADAGGDAAGGADGDRPGG